MIVRTFGVAILSCLLQACSAQPPKNESVETVSPIPSTNKAVYAAEIEKQYQQLLGNKGFNGSILVAKNGEVLFEDYKGYSNFKTKEPITPNTTFHLASVSKTFTGMAILKLREQGKLNLDDFVTDFFPDFPYPNITVQLLLNHRSGLNNYVYFLVDRKVETYRVKNKKGRWVRRTRTIKMPPLKPGLLTNQDMLDYMIKYKPAPLFGPDKAFRYSNTNYALLALIIEKVTGQSYPTYLKDSLFTPLGMTDSYVFSLADTGRYVPSYKNNNVPYRIEKLDCIYGDKNVYSTVRDMFLWDRALQEGIYVNQASQTLAYQPYSFETKSFHNYGLGWRLLNSPTEEIVYHNGWWHGNNTVFTRYIKDSATIIVLGNRYNRNIYKAKKLSSAFTGRTDTTELEE
nr:serine hydrolase domain-containing protein [uncultured Sediminibacterium sp.]